MTNAQFKSATNAELKEHGFDNKVVRVFEAPYIGNTTLEFKYDLTDEEREYLSKRWHCMIRANMLMIKTPKQWEAERQQIKNTHEVIDMVYTEEEGNVVKQGTLQECHDWVAEQCEHSPNSAFTYIVMPIIHPNHKKESK